LAALEQRREKTLALKQGMMTSKRKDETGMSTITPHYKNVQLLLQSQSFSIDEYQREYKWEKENIDELLTDLRDKFLTCYQHGHKTNMIANYEDYFLGSIIVSKRSGKNYLIDGQQRVKFGRGQHSGASDLLRQSGKSMLQSRHLGAPSRGVLKLAGSQRCKAISPQLNTPVLPKHDPRTKGSAAV
jgi:hypothetical protein